MRMASQRDPWYDMVSAKFYSNHVGKDVSRRANQKAAQQSDEALNAIKPTLQCVKSRCEYGVAKFPAARYRTSHFDGVHV